MIVDQDDSEIGLSRALEDHVLNLHAEALLEAVSLSKTQIRQY
jgi:hypothetical protein